MRPTNPTTEAFRLFNACPTPDDVLDARATLLDDVEHAADVFGLGSTAHAHATALLAAFDILAYPES